MAKKLNTNYYCGIENEGKVLRKYKRNGASDVKQMPGSKGSYDLEVSHPSRKKHFVQVKSTCSTTGEPKCITSKERQRLIRAANSQNGIAVVAYVGANGRSELRYAKNDRLVVF